MQNTAEVSAEKTTNKQAGPRDAWLKIWCSVSALALIGVTYRLWFPSGGQDYPLVPMLEVLCDASWQWDWVAATGLCIGWLIAWKLPRLGNPLILLFGVLCILLDQHRIQPWHYQLIVFAYVFLVAQKKHQQIWLRAFLISIYCYSALGKLDFEFLHTIGPQFLEQLAKFRLLEGQTFSPLQTAALPLCELLLALGLLLPKVRSIAACGMCLLHLSLIAILGPLGLNHSPGVVLWNFHFAGLVLLLFFRSPPDSARMNELFSPANLSNYCVGIVLVPVLVLPLLERLGYWDHWPSWALYAPHSSRTDIQVASHRIEDLPDELAELIPEAEEGTLWARIPISKWSLESVGVPVYPQARYQLGLAVALAEKIDSEFEIRVRLFGAASRWNGKRQTEFAEGRSKIERAQEQFWLNVHPRYLSADE